MIKRFRFTILLCFLFILLLSGCGSKEPEIETEPPVHLLYLDVDFIGNILFDKYDLVLFVDGNREAILPQGEYYTKLFELDEGEHEILFQKEGDDSIFTSTTIELIEDSTLSATVKTHKSDIEFSKELISGIEGNMLEVPAVNDMVLSEALDALEKKGLLMLRSMQEMKFHLIIQIG